MFMTTEESTKRMKDGRLYLPNDETLMQKQLEHLELLYDYNNTRPLEQKKREELLKKMFADIGRDCYIEPPLHANWAGANVHFGNNVYANFGLTLVDDTDIFVGDNVMFGPNVVVATAGHPIEKNLRYLQMQFNIPVHIGTNVWIGASSVILPGVTIGNNTVIGAGSVVTKDIPSNVIAVGNPCRVLREISERDREFYFKDRKVDVEIPDTDCP